MFELYDALKNFTDKVCDVFKESLEYLNTLHNDSNVKENSGK